MRSKLIVPVVLLMFLTGCNYQQAAQNAVNVISGILNIAAAEEPVLPPADTEYFTPWVALGQNLVGQANTCIAASGNTKAKLAKCLTTLTSNLMSPTEMAELRIMSPSTQKKVQLYGTAVIVAVNAILTQWNQPAQAAPVVSPTSFNVNSSEMVALRSQLVKGGYL